MTLSSDAREAFADTNTISFPSSALYDDFKSRIENINAMSATDQISGMQKLAHYYYTHPDKLSGTGLNQACRIVIDWHIAKINEPGCANPEHIITSLQRAIGNIGCHAFMTGDGDIKKDDALKLKDALIARTLREIENADSGMVADMVIKDYSRALRHLNLKMDQETRLSFIASTEKRCAEKIDELADKPVYQDMWKEWAISIRQDLTRHQNPTSPSLGIAA